MIRGRTSISHALIRSRCHWCFSTFCKCGHIGVQTRRHGRCEQWALFPVRVTGLHVLHFATQRSGSCGARLILFNILAPAISFRMLARLRIIFLPFSRTLSSHSWSTINIKFESLFAWTQLKPPSLSGSYQVCRVWSCEGIESCIV